MITISYFQVSGGNLKYTKHPFGQKVVEIVMAEKPPCDVKVPCNKNVEDKDFALLKIEFGFWTRRRVSYRVPSIRPATGLTQKGRGFNSNNSMST